MIKHRVNLILFHGVVLNVDNNINCTYQFIKKKILIHCRALVSLVSKLTMYNLQFTMYKNFFSTYVSM